MSTAPPESESSIINVPAAPVVPEKKRQGVSWLVWTVDFVLLLVAVVGAFYTWRAQTEALRLAKKRADLERRVGQMPIADESKYHVLRLPSEKPNEFRWRVFAPARSSHWLQMKSCSDGSSSVSSGGGSGNPESSEGLVRAMFRFEDNGTLQLTVKFRMTGNQSSHQTQIFDKQIAEMVRKNDFSSWKVAASNGIETFDINDLIPFLHVETPSVRENGQGGLLNISFGTQEAATAKDTGT